MPKIPDFLSLRREVGKQIADAKAAAANAVEQIDAAIREKTEAAHQLSRRVSAADAATHLAASLRSTIAQSRAELQRRADAALFLRAHRPTREIGGVFDGNGDSPLRTLNATPVEVLSWPIDPTEVLALTMTDAQIDAWALQAARNAGAADQGPRLDQLQAEHDRLIDELIELHDQRRQAREYLCGLIEVTISPLVPDSFFQPNTDGVDVPQHFAPSVNQMDDNGQPVITAFGHSTQELIAALNK